MKMRPLTEADFPAVLEMIREDEEQINGAPSRLGLQDLQDWLSRTALPEDTCLCEDDQGPCALVWADFPPGDDLGVAIVILGPRCKSTELGSELLGFSEERARDRAMPRLQQIALGKDEFTQSLIRSRGYREVRRFYEMAIELDDRPKIPNVATEQLQEADVRAFHDALEEAFEDHWEHHSYEFDAWWERHRDNPNLDLSLWFLIREGGEIAAVARNEANRNGGGYVGALGVRRPYRGKGYAKALLLRTFAEFWDRGMPRVTLGVDAESPTGATHLYERVGMCVEQENVVFEKALDV